VDAILNAFSTEALDEADTSVPYPRCFTAGKFELSAIKPVHINPVSTIVSINLAAKV
jgi:hypothetical protein